MKNSIFLTLFALVFTVADLSANKYKLGIDKEDEKQPKSEVQKKKELVHSVVQEFYTKGATALKEGKLERAEGYFDRVLILDPNHEGARDGIDLIMSLYEKSEKKISPVEVDPKTALVENLFKEWELENKKGNLEESAMILEKIIAIDPQNKVAHRKIKDINRKLYKRAVARGSKFEKADQIQKAIDAYQTALNYKRDPALKAKIASLRGQRASLTKKKSDALYLEALTASQNGELGKALALCQKALTMNPDNLQAKRMAERLQSKTIR